MRYVSTFSGVEAASVAWGPLGWKPAAFAEIDPFPSAVLAERYPGVPNLGDITKVDWKRWRGKCDLVVGGSPCQSFSVAGKREGLRGESGLMFEYIRCVREVRPRWLLWENVPGALTSERGEAFRCLLSSLDDLGYGLAWRVLDAQFFGVAQRRRRVFLVGRLGERPPACVLFEPDCLRGDTPSSKQKRQELAARAGRGPACAGFKAGAGAAAGGIGFGEETSPTLTAGESGTNRSPAVAIQGSMIGRSEANGPQGSGVEDDGACYTLNCTDRHGVLAFAQNSRDEVRIQGDGTPSGALSASPGMKQTTYVCETARTGSNGLGAGESDVAGTLDTAMSLAVAIDGGPSTKVSEGVCRTLRRGGEGGTHDAAAVTQYGEELAGTLTASDPSPCADRGQNVVCLGDDNAKASCDVEMAGSLKCGGSAPIAGSPAMVVRRLTPRECERLQGFPDDWTRIPWRGKPAEECPDGPRYKAIGNSMAVPVMRWIGERIAMCERGDIR